MGNCFNPNKTPSPITGNSHSTAKMDGVSSSLKAQTYVKQARGKLRQNYKIGKKLGEGGFGEVRLCKHIASGEARAVKYLKKDMLTHEDKELILNEVRILSEMDHPNIVRLFEFYDEPAYYCLVQEVCSGGELFDAIIKSGKFKENTARILIKAMLSCMNYCHGKGVVHRDLKPENILLEPDMDMNKMKIIDFGTAVPYDQKGKRGLKEVLGTPFYIAPEVLNANYNEKCDIWSIGVITYMVLSGKAPFYGKTDPDIYASVRRGKFEFSAVSWKSVSQDAKDFITSLLTVDYKKRPSAQQALDHKWIQMVRETVDTDVAVDVLANMKTFRANQILKQAAFGYMASQLVSKSEKEKLGQMFKTFDKNSDGRLDKKEIQMGYENYQQKIISDEDIDKVFGQIDVDGNGYIDYTEFVAAAIEMEQLTTDSKLKRAFSLFDSDGSGKISSEEIRNVLGLTDNNDMNEKIKEIINQVDDNGDGEISLDEFKFMMQKIAE